MCRCCVCVVDADGDRIVISSDEELTDAIEQLDGSVFKIHVKTTTAGDCCNMSSKHWENVVFSNVTFCCM